MTTHTISLTDYRRKTSINRLGLWLFILSDMFVFLGLLVARFYLLGFQSRPEASQIVGLIVTAVLLASSFFMNRAETAMAPTRSELRSPSLRIFRQICRKPIRTLIPCCFSAVHSTFLN